MNALKAGTIATINEKKHAFAQLQCVFAPLLVLLCVLMRAVET